MGALSPGDLVKDHKGVLGPLLLAVVVIIGIGVFYSQGGDILTTGENLGEDLGGGNTTERKTYDNPPEMNLDDGVDYYAVIETNFGDIEVDLLEENAPKTVNNFVFLAKDGFFDGLTFHRVVEGFVIQGGDPKGDGTGGPGYTFQDEINPDSIGLDQILVKQATFLSGLYSTWNAATSAYAPNNLREHADDTLSEFYDDEVGYDYDYGLDSISFAPGVIAMANSGPDTNGSQFFITVSGSDTSQLNGRHTVFGRVTEGMDVVDEIAGVPVDDSDKPVSAVEIESITIRER
jgi:cyclophilin family peptidyl-prolyl cis-trans isomerase